LLQELTESAIGRLDRAQRRLVVNRSRIPVAAYRWGSAL